MDLGGVAYGGGTFIVVGGNGTVIQSGTLAPWQLWLGPIKPLIGGAFSIAITGPSGVTWQVEASTDLIKWVALTNFTHSDLVG